MVDLCPSRRQENSESRHFSILLNCPSPTRLLSSIQVSSPFYPYRADDQRHVVNCRTLLRLIYYSLTQLSSHHMINFSALTPLYITTCGVMTLLVSARLQVHAADVVVNIDRTTLDWSDLGLGAPSAADDADQSENPRAVFRYVTGYGKPHAEAGARDFVLPRLNDGKLPGNDDDNANNTWFDTAKNSRILVDLGESTNIARINVYSWHSGALSPQQYTLWAAAGDTQPNAASADLANDWQEIAKVNTFSLGEGGKHGSSINGKDGVLGQYRYLLFDLPANRPDWSRSGFLSEIDVYKVGRPLDKVRAVDRDTQSGRQTLKFGDIHLTKPLNEATPYLLSGQKLYAYGSMNGTFPRVGRLGGEQGGLWCHPIKLLDSFECAIQEEGQSDWPLQGPATQFVHEFASCTFTRSHNDLTISRRDFVPENEPALFSLLTLRNESENARQLKVRLKASVNIRPSYESRLPNGADVVSYQDGLVSAFDSEAAGKWGLVFGCNQTPEKHHIDSNEAILTYAVTLPPQGETTLHTLIAGEHVDGVDRARDRFATLRGRAAEMLGHKQQIYADRILGGAKFDCSDETINVAFTCAKANVLMSEMDLQPNYPAPFLAAGFPIYTWLFGCDSLYSTPGVAASGFNELAANTLDCLLHFAAQKKQGAHEVASNGRLLGWNHIQETPQLVHACWKHFQWTGDMSFLKRAYPVCKESMAHVVATADRDKDGYLEGPGLMEQSGMGPERIASACYLFAAYESLAEMARALGESGAPEYRQRAAEFRKNFNEDWWNEEEQMWACSLRDDESQTMDDFWAVCFPQEVDLATDDKAKIALARIENEWVNDQWGFVAQRRETIADAGVGVVHNNILAQIAFRYGKADLGWKLIKLSAKAPLEARMLGAFDETMPGGGDLMQLWSFGPYLEAIVGGLAGIKANASEHKIELYPQFPKDLDHYDLQDVAVGEHKISVHWKRNEGGHHFVLTHTAGSADLQLTFRVSIDENTPVEMNSKTMDAELQALRGVMTKVIDASLRPGASMTFRF